MKLKAFFVILSFSLIFLSISCTSFNFDTPISGTLTTSDNKDSDGYYWKDFYFTPVAGMTYTVVVTAGSNNLGSHISVNDYTQTSQSGSGTLIYKPTLSSGVLIAHVSVYSLPGYLPISYTINISKKY